MFARYDHSAGKGEPPVKRILIAVSVEAEREAVLRGAGRDPRFDVRITGAGSASAAARTAQLLAGGGYGLALSAGIAGGFPGKAAIGSVVVADAIVAADFGAETADGGFLPVDELGFGSARIGADRQVAERIGAAIASAGIAAAVGTVLTVATATGTAETAAKLAARYPEAAAEGMEGFGVATAAAAFGVPALELRAVSNAVGPRDRSAWRIGEALAALEKASAILPEVLT